MALTQDNILQTMSYHLGEATIPSSGTDDRKEFIQHALERVLDAYPFDPLFSVATVSIAASGNLYQGSFPTNMKQNSRLDVRVINSGTGDDYIYDEVPYTDQDSYVAGDYKFWRLGLEGVQTLNTRDTPAAVTVRYETLAPSINASISVSLAPRFKNVIALGALVDFRLSENPLADIAVDEAKFQLHLREAIAAQSRREPQHRFKSIAETTGHQTGEIGD